MSRLDSVSLKEHYDALLREKDRALELFGSNLDVRLDNLNHIKEERDRDRATFLRKDLYEREHDLLRDNMQKMEKKLSVLQGMGIVLMFLSGILGAIVAHLLK